MLGLLFSLVTCWGEFASVAHGDRQEERLWPTAAAGVLLVALTVVVALVSEIIVGSVQYAALACGT